MAMSFQLPNRIDMQISALEVVVVYSYKVSFCNELLLALYHVRREQQILT